MPISKKHLLVRDAKRDIGAELLLSVRQMTSGDIAVVTHIETPATESLDAIQNPMPRVVKSGPESN